MSAQLFTAVSNLAYGNFPVDAYHPPDESRFPTIEQAREWLKGLRCGGSIVTWRDGDFRIIEILDAGADEFRVIPAKAPAAKAP